MEGSISRLDRILVRKEEAPKRAEAEPRSAGTGATVNNTQTAGYYERVWHGTGKFKWYTYQYVSALPMDPADKGRVEDANAKNSLKLNGQLQDGYLSYTEAGEMGWSSDVIWDADLDKDGMISAREYLLMLDSINEKINKMYPFGISEEGRKNVEAFLLSRDNGVVINYDMIGKEGMRLYEEINGRMDVLRTDPAYSGLSDEDLFLQALKADPARNWDSLEGPGGVVGREMAEWIKVVKKAEGDTSSQALFEHYFGTMWASHCSLEDQKTYFGIATEIGDTFSGNWLNFREWFAGNADPMVSVNDDDASAKLDKDFVMREWERTGKLEIMQNLIASGDWDSARALFGSLIRDLQQLLKYHPGSTLILSAINAEMIKFIDSIFRSVQGSNDREQSLDASGLFDPSGNFSKMDMALRYIRDYETFVNAHSKYRNGSGLTKVAGYYSAVASALTREMEMGNDPKLQEQYIKKIEAVIGDINRVQGSLAGVSGKGQDARKGDLQLAMTYITLARVQDNREARDAYIAKALDIAEKLPKAYKAAIYSQVIKMLGQLSMAAQDPDEQYKIEEQVAALLDQKGKGLMLNGKTYKMPKLNPRWFTYEQINSDLQGVKSAIEQAKRKGAVYEHNVIWKAIDGYLNPKVTPPTGGYKIDFASPAIQGRPVPTIPDNIDETAKKYVEMIEDFASLYADGNDPSELRTSGLRVWDYLRAIDIKYGKDPKMMAAISTAIDNKITEVLGSVNCKDKKELDKKIKALERIPGNRLTPEQQSKLMELYRVKELIKGLEGAKGAKGPYRKGMTIGGAIKEEETNINDCIKSN